MEYLESFDMWCWRKMEKPAWAERMKNEVLRAVKVERKIVLTKKKETRLTGLVTSGVGTAFYNTLLKES